MAVLAAPQ